MLYLSYVPLLTSPIGVLRDESGKEGLIQMLTDAALEYRIQGIAWAESDSTKPYPVFIVPHGVDICAHLVEWSKGKPENFFTLVWRPNPKGGYDAALLPNFEKSARRYHACTGDRTPLTILGHIFLYQVEQSVFDICRLREQRTVRLGWTEGLEGLHPKGYAECRVACQRWDSLPEEDRTMLERYWTPCLH